MKDFPMLTQTEENYLKSIYKIYERSKEVVHTNAIAHHLNTTPASVTDMMKKLARKKLVSYEKYKGTKLTAKGAQVATGLIRKHRLWETFLHLKLDFSWEEVHDIAEDLEHIQSEKLINHLDAFLEYPKYDPHGDPIPSADGKFTLRDQVSLTKLEKGQGGMVVGVKDHDNQFLEYLNELEISLGSQIDILDQYEYDGSMKIQVDKAEPVVISVNVGQNLLVKKSKK